MRVGEMITLGQRQWAGACEKQRVVPLGRPPITDRGACPNGELRSLSRLSRVGRPDEQLYGNLCHFHVLRGRVTGNCV